MDKTWKTPLWWHFICLLTRICFVCCHYYFQSWREQNQGSLKTLFLKKRTNLKEITEGYWDGLVNIGRITFLNPYIFQFFRIAFFFKFRLCNICNESRKVLVRPIDKYHSCEGQMDWAPNNKDYINETINILFEPYSSRSYFEEVVRVHLEMYTSSLWK